MKKLSYLFLAASISLSACSKNDPPLPDNLLNFTAATQGMDAAATSATVTLSLSRATDVALPITLEITASGVTYGTEFTTEPTATNGTLNLTIPAGSNSVSFKVNKAANIFLNGNEYITVAVKSAGNGAILGADKSLKLSFASITSTGAQLTLQGGEGGAAAINSVYVDLSANAQTSVKRADWDLGFVAGADSRVIINNAAAASVVAVNKTDINAVTAADVTLANLAIGFGAGTFNIIDDVAGDLSKTAIAAISATDADNKVYVLSRSGGSGVTPAAADLYKVRILRATNGYTLQYAKLTETTFKTLNVTKNSAYNFNFVSLATGAAVNVEPAKDRWDIQWTYSIYFSGDVPYAFSDLVFVNYLGGTQTAEVIANNYDAFAENDLTGITFTSNRNTIGSNWRNTSPGTTVGVKTDRFYLVKDAGGNIYKLKFVSFHTADGGTRGYPVIKYALVKKGA